MLFKVNIKVLQLLLFVGLVLQSPYLFAAGGNNPPPAPISMSISGPTYVSVSTQSRRYTAYTVNLPNYATFFYEWYVHHTESECGLAGEGTNNYFDAQFLDGAGEYSVECTLRDYNWNVLSTAATTVTAVTLDLDVDSNYDGSINGTDESLEMSAGGVVPLGGRKPIRITTQGNLGTVTLSAVYGGEKISVWSASSGGTQIQLGQQLQVGTTYTFYVQGNSTSSLPQDIVLRLRNTYGTVNLDDVITLTVVNPTVDLDVDSDYDGIIDNDDDSLETSAGGVVPLGDRVEIRIASQGSLGLQKLVLSAVSGGDKITVESQLGAQIELGQPLSTGTYYVKGVSASSGVRDIELRLNMKCGTVNLDDYIKLTVVNVELENIAEDHSPLPNLDDARRMCNNAQDEYKKIKLRASVKPDGTTAKVYSTAPNNGASLTIEGITSGFNPDAVKDGDEFWAVAGSSIGTYNIVLLHNMTPGSNPVPWCWDDVVEKVFKFEFEKQFDSADTIPGGTTGGATFNGTSKVSTDAYGSPEWCSFPTSTKNHAVSKKATYGINHNIKVITNPPNMHSGYAKAKFSSQVDVKFDATMLEDGTANNHGVDVGVSYTLIPNILAISKNFGDNGSRSEGGALGNASIRITNPNNGDKIGGDLLNASFTSEDINLTFYAGPTERGFAKSESYTQQSGTFIYEVSSTICEVDVYLGVVAEVDDKSVWEYQYQPYPSGDRPSEYYERKNISDVLNVSYELKDLKFTPVGDFEIIQQPME